ncbi:MAG: hypothetical protein HOP29_11260 [Phycisphaerales bacterium]|nr:hypothetical protein [Phycisphaerales bacterium]
MASRTNDRPIFEARAGGIVGAVWSESSTLNGRPITNHSIRIEKRYRDERTGEWKTTGYLRPDDLPKLALVATNLYEHLMLRVGEVQDAQPTQTVRQGSGTSPTPVER